VAHWKFDAVRAHGIVVLKGQNFNRAEQVAFSAALGEVIVLPSSFEGQIPEPFQSRDSAHCQLWANSRGRDRR
jgi:taurine dioxygenase